MAIVIEKEENWKNHFYKRKQKDKIKICPSKNLFLEINEGKQA